VVSHRGPTASSRRSEAGWQIIFSESATAAWNAADVQASRLGGAGTRALSLVQQPGGPSVAPQGFAAQGQVGRHHKSEEADAELTDPLTFSALKSEDSFI
jgi:hypothetical protein